MRTPAELTDELRRQGLKNTPQRQLIFRLLHGNHAHPSAEAVYAAAVAEMPSISLRTVYQALNDLATMGEIQALDLGTGAARFDPNVDDHHHLVCDGCGAVRDVYLPAAELDVAADGFTGFRVERAQVVFRGRCQACDDLIRSNQSQGEPPHG